MTELCWTRSLSVSWAYDDNKCTHEAVLTVPFGIVTEIVCQKCGDRSESLSVGVPIATLPEVLSFCADCGKPTHNSLGLKFVWCDDCYAKAEPCTCCPDSTGEAARRTT